MYKEDGSDVLGVYPLLPDGTCRFIVFDFDNHEKDAEATEFANVTWYTDIIKTKICSNDIAPLYSEWYTIHAKNNFVYIEFAYAT